MGDRIAINAAAAGSAGASFRKILTFSAKAAGNYVLNETNFPGLGQYLPCNAFVVVDPGAAGGALQISTDNGTTWLQLQASADTTVFGSYVYLDTANTLRVVITTNPADVRIYIQ